LNFRSTFSQIVWLQLLAIAVTSLAMPIGIYLFLDRTVSAYQIEMLGNREQVLLHGMSAAADGGVALPPGLAAPYAQEISGFAFSITDAAGRVLLSSSPGLSPLAPVPPTRAQAVFRRRTGKGTYFGSSFPETFQGRPIWIQVEQNQDNPDAVLDDVVARFLPAAGVLSAGLLLFLLAADIVIVRRALRPIVRASSMAGDISPSNMDLRLPTERMPSEIMPLVVAVNQAFDRLEQGFRAQRDLTADVAHELRTPLSVLRMRVESLSENEVRRRLLADIDVLSRMANQLLSIAELETVVIGPTDQADLRQVCLEVVELLAPLAVAQGKAMELTGARRAVQVHGRPDLLFQAVRNLVENAIRHSPPNGTVTVEVVESGGVRVLDRGPGVPQAMKARLFERFWPSRRKERSAIGGGAGLGLSIVARIADEHGGSVSVEDRPGGGAVFSVTLRPVQAGVNA
jgi:signal transduction histidine kinase